MLRLENLSLAFGHRQLLQNLSLRLSEGELCWLKGANGSGKTTLLNLISGVIPEYVTAEFEAEIWLGELSLKDLPIREKFRYLWFAQNDPETQFLMPSCEAEIAFALENRGMPAEQIKRQVDSSLNLLGLQNCRWQAPQTLSRGQQKLLLCAIGNALDPPCYLLDEPLSGLSDSSVALVLTWIRLQKAKRKIFLVAEHNDALRHLADKELQLSDATAFVQSGSIHQSAEPDSVLLPLKARGQQHNLDKKPNLLVSTQDLGFAYQDSTQLFSNLSFTISRHQNILLQGENGSGKSTLLKLMLGLLKPQCGRTAFAGNSQSGFDAGYFRHAYYQPQNTSASLLGLTASQNWLLWKLSLVELPDYPSCADHLLSELSAGEQRLVSQGILPYIIDKFWMLDEPFASLDLQASENLKELLAWKARQRPGMIIVAHASDNLEGIFDEIWTINPTGIEINRVSTEAEQS